MSGSLKDIAKVLATAKKTTSKQPMGRLAEVFVRSVYSGAHGSAERGDQKDISVSFSLRMDLDPALTAERKKALRPVVAERNKLIHKWAASFDPNSLETFKTLEVALDEQHTRIWPEFETLKAIVLAVREHHREVAQYLTSDSFLAEFKERIASA